MPLNPWAARYNTWLFFKLAPEGAVLSSPFFGADGAMLSPFSLQLTIAADASAVLPACLSFPKECPPIFLCSASKSNLSYAQVEEVQPVPGIVTLSQMV